MGILTIHRICSSHSGPAPTRPALCEMLDGLTRTLAEVGHRPLRILKTESWQVRPQGGDGWLLARLRIECEPGRADASARLLVPVAAPDLAMVARHAADGRLRSGRARRCRAPSAGAAAWWPGDASGSPVMSGAPYSGDAARLILATALILALALAVTAVLGALVGRPLPLVALP